MPCDVAIQFVKALLENGAVSASLGGSEQDKDSAIRIMILIELSADPMQRQRIFDFIELNEIQHCSPASPEEVDIDDVSRY